jgi:hypothetical protein
MGAADSAFYIELCSSVRYDVDRCTKNKRMIRILGQGFFLTCTENFFIRNTQHKNRSGCI